MAGKNDGDKPLVSMAARTGQQNIRHSCILDRVENITTGKAAMKIDVVTKMGDGTDHSIHSTKPNEQESATTLEP